VWWRSDLRRCDGRSAPEDAGWVVVDLVKDVVDGAGVKIVVAMPAAVAVGPVQGPGVGVGVVAELGDGETGPVGEVGMPRGPAVEDGHGLAAYVGFDAHFVAQVSGCASGAVLADAGEVEVGDRGHPATVSRVQPARRRRVRVEAGTWAGSVWRSRAMEVSER